MSTPASGTFEQGQHRRAFGDAVRGHRVRQGLTQEDLSERSGLHRTYVVGVETGARNPTLDVITRLALALDVAVADLFSQSE